MDYTINGKTIVIKRRQKSPSLDNTPQRRVTGRIVDKQGEPIVGASVKVLGTTMGTISDADGQFALNAPAGSRLDISYISFENQVVNANDGVTITMSENTKLLNEVVVTALGIKREEKALGYATQKLDGNSLSKVKGTNVAASLTGKIAGMNVQNSTEFNEIGRAHV